MCDIEYTEDGCPNDCEYCKKCGLDCVYEVPQEECEICKKELFHSEVYSYRDTYKHICYECLQKIKKTQL